MRNLEIDTSLSYNYGDSFQFEENFKILEYSGYRKTSMSLYIDYGNLSSEYDIEQDCMIEDNRENRVKIQRWLTQQGYKVFSEVYGTVEEIIETLYDIDYNNIQEVYDVLSSIGVFYTTNYLRTSTSGYSQGDYANILINIVEFEKVMGAKFELDGMKKWFDHYFWDSEVSGTINVSFDYTQNAVNFTFDEEFDFREWCGDEYEADSVESEMIALYIQKQVKVPLPTDDIKMIAEKLDNIDYNDVSYPRCGC